MVVAEREYCHPEGVTGIGSLNAEIMLVGIAPGKDEFLRSKQPFTGPSGRLLDGLLKLIGLTREQVFLTNLYCQWNDSPTDDQIEGCSARFWREVATIKPKIIVCLGKIVTEHMLRLIPENPNFTQRTFGKCQGGMFWNETLNCWMLSTYHPAAYLYNDNKVTAEIHDGVRDFRKLGIYLNAPKTFGNVGYQVMSTLQECDAMLQHYVDYEHDYPEVAIDVETFYDGSGMLSIAFACEHGVYHIPKHLVYGPDYAVLEQSDCHWTFHNGQFDTQQISLHLNTNLTIVEDTMLMSYSLDERAGGDTEDDATGQERSVGIHGLKRLAMEYCGGEHYAENAKNRIDKMSPEELAFYNSSDAAYTYRLVRFFKPLQIDDGVRTMYEDILIPAANTFRDINRRGAYIDSGALHELAEDWIPKLIDLYDKMMKSSRSLGWTHDLDINLNSPKQLSELIYDICMAPQIGQGKLARSTSRPIILQMVKEYPEHVASIWLQTLLDFRGLNRDINTYLKGVEEAKDSNGFIHPEGLLHGTRNGRMSWHNPPVQTIPKARTVGADRARIRKLFAAAPPSKLDTGVRVLVEADMRQAELFIAAFVAQDDVMLEDLTIPMEGETKADFHARVAKAGFNKVKAECEPLEWEYLRDSSKRLVYAQLYGAAPSAVVEERKMTGVGGSNYQFIDSLDKAKALFKAFLTRYHKFKSWRDNEQRIVQTEGEQVSRTGRKRRYYMIQSYSQLNQAINTPISSFSHDFLLAAIIELYPLLKEFDSHIIFEVHDSILFDVPRKYLKEVHDLIQQVMTKPRWGTPQGVPIDVKVGKNWYEMEDFDKVINQVNAA